MLDIEPTDDVVIPTVGGERATLRHARAEVVAPRMGFARPQTGELSWGRARAPRATSHPRHEDFRRSEDRVPLVFVNVVPSLALLTLTACGATATAPLDSPRPSGSAASLGSRRGPPPAPAATDEDAADQGGAEQGDAGPDTSVEGPSRPEERDQLVAFYEATKGRDWVRQDFWLSSRPHCEWHGVECDQEGYVEQLTLYDNDLAGSLPPTICELPRLHTLYLSFNRIGGGLPSRIGDCRALKNLWVKANQLGGQIPAGICDGGSLVWLDLHENRFTGSIPREIGRCRALEVLRLDHNQLTGSLPPELGELVTLRELYLHHNRLKGSLAPLGSTRGLTHLFVANNRFEGPIPDLSALSGLVAFRAENNRLSGTLPPSLASLATLQVLRVDGNSLRGPVPPSVAAQTERWQVCALGGAACDGCADRCRASPKE